MHSLSYSQEKYEEYLAFLIGYARDDWLGFSVISPKVARVAADDASLEELILVFRKLISDLLDAGAKIGDFADTEGAPFVGWPGTKEENLAKMETEIRKLGKLPMSGDVGWITSLDH
jgi:hypothetical protein